jgi:putative redox protein
VAHVELTWIDRQRFLGVDSGGHAVVLSPGDDIGVKPAETLLIALAACAAHNVVAILRKQRARLERLVVSVSGEQAASPPRAFQNIHLRFRVMVAGVRPAQLERAVDLALNKYCSVRASLAPEIVVTFAVELQPPDLADGSADG